MAYQKFFFRGGRIRTREAYAEDLQSPSFDHLDTPFIKWNGVGGGTWTPTLKSTSA